MMFLKGNSVTKRMHFGGDYDRHVTVVEVTHRTKLGAEIFLIFLEINMGYKKLVICRNHFLQLQDFFCNLFKTVPIGIFGDFVRYLC